MTYPAWMLDPPDPCGPVELTLPCPECGAPVWYESLELDELPGVARPLEDVECSDCGHCLDLDPLPLDLH